MQRAVAHRTKTATPRRCNYNSADLLSRSRRHASGCDGTARTAVQSVQMCRLVQQTSSTDCNQSSLAEACGSRMYSHTEFQALRRNVVEQKGNKSALRNG